MNLENDEYIIDFERVNQLTAHPNDTANQTGYQPVFIHGVSRSIIKDYLKEYTDSTIKGKSINPSIIKTLIWNKILIGKAEIRDKKIEDIL